MKTKRAMTPEDRAIYLKRVSTDAQKAYERAHAVDSAATDLWFVRRGYVDIARRVRCLAVTESYWEIVRKHPRTLGKKLSCGCCRGPEGDRCCCHMHMDIPRGIRPKLCTRHGDRLLLV